jgi:hypothetical protein
MIVYKYAGDSGLKIIEGLRLKVTPPNEFNDPFEITPNSRRARPLTEMLADVSKDSKFYQGVFNDMVQDGFYHDSLEQFIKDLPSELPKYYAGYKTLSRKEMAKRDMKTLDDVSPALGILCFSKPVDDIPMWSYYANHHRGAVFGIDVNKIGGRLPGFSGFVKYRKHRVRYNPFSPLSQKQRLQTIFTKSHEWRHEQEYRRVFRLSDLISPPVGKGEEKKYFLDISSDSIREIIFGCRIAPDLEAKIREEMQRRKKTFEHVRLLKCVRHASKFALKIVPA